MHPQIALNAKAVALAVIVSFMFGWLWYGPLFGKSWAKLQGIKYTNKVATKDMMKGMGLGLLGSFLTAYVMTFSTNVWRASVCSGHGADMEWWRYGFYGGMFVWLGFTIPILFSSIAWEGKSWKLFAINASYHFLNLQIISMIVAGMR